MITKDVELSNDITLTLKSLTIDDLASNNEVIDLFIEMMRILQEGKDGNDIMNEIINNVPSLCYLLISLSIVNESKAENFMTPSHIKNFFNLQDQLTLLSESVALSVNDFDKLLKQKDTAVKTSEKLTKLMNRLYKK